ncbi:HAD family hydrolase [Endozoicomonas sp. OPT23]|uniref:HAD family hydrolase n=1 Tax=Endozoicomonas sp. OPT23 TaxID=2072845 RepID=UPI00129ABD5A|nr:HAD-IA family hydrolase [Endozoicomonas sp. OPT23]MRI33070.1 HAD family hydrolase [Endozoicomonas sp. OPT23]
MIKLITFDLDDTLWDNMPVLIRAEQKAWKRLNDYWPETHKRLDPKSVFEYRLKIREQRPELKYRLTELRHYSIKKILQVCNCPASKAEQIADDLMQEFLDWRHEVKCFPEVQPVLSYLSSKYRIGAVTNGNVDVSRLSVSEYFDFSLKGEDFDSIKPEPTLFLKALELANVAPEETLHVGDCLKADVAGAGALGIKTAWFNPQDKELPEGANPDYVIRSLTGVLRILNTSEDTPLTESA